MLRCIDPQTKRPSARLLRRRTAELCETKCNGKCQQWSKSQLLTPFYLLYPCLWFFVSHALALCSVFVLPLLCCSIFVFDFFFLFLFSDTAIALSWNSLKMWPIMHFILYFGYNCRVYPEFECPLSIERTMAGGKNGQMRKQAAKESSTLKHTEKHTHTAKCSRCATYVKWTVGIKKKNIFLTSELLITWQCSLFFFCFIWNKNRNNLLGESN